MPADDAPYESRMSNVVEPAVLPVALPGSIYDGQIARRAGLKKPPFQSARQGLRMSRSHKSSTGNCIAILNKPDRFICGTEFCIYGTTHLGHLSLEPSPF